MAAAPTYAVPDSSRTMHRAGAHHAQGDSSAYARLGETPPHTVVTYSLSLSLSLPPPLVGS